MNPAIEDRLSSVVRALTDIIMPALPPEAGLAREQLQLSVGHLQIICAQIGRTAAFEAEEFADAQRLAASLAALSSDLGLAVSVTGPADRAARSANASDAKQAIHAVILAAAETGSQDAFRRLGAAVLASEDERSRKDRQWFAPMGFDQEAG